MSSARFRAAGVALGLAALLAACNNNMTTTTPDPVPTTVLFGSRLPAGGFAWRSITVPKAGTVTVQLAALAAGEDVAVDLSLGQISGTTCTPLLTIQTVVGTEPQISQPVLAGDYCVQIADPGNLTATSNFLITIVIPAA
jgi:hypothetical protein